MKIVVIGDMSQMGSKVITILKQNTPRTITTAQDRAVDTVSDDFLPGRGVAEESDNPSPGGPGCRGKDCTRCSSCAAIDRLMIADPKICRPDAPTARTTNDDPDAHYCGVRLADLRLLPDCRAIREATPFGGWSASLPSPREK